MPKKKTVSPPKKENIDEFFQAIQNGYAWALKIATSGEFTNFKYKKEDILNWLQNPQNYQREFRQVHYYLMNVSLHYRRLVEYFSNMLTFDYYIYPLDVSNFSNRTFQRDYAKALGFLQKLDIKKEFKDITKVLIAEDVGYFYLRDEGENLTIQRISSDFCKLVAKTNIGFQYAIDLEKMMRAEVDITGYPKEIQRAYKRYVTKKEGQEYIVDIEYGIAFKFDELTSYAIPPFVGLFVDAIEIMSYKELVKTKAKLNNYKLLTQKIPMKNDTKNGFLIDLSVAGKYHNNIKQNLPDGIGIVTTPMEVESINLEKQQNDESFIGVGEKHFYGSAGVSSILFNSEKAGSVGLSKSIMVDETFVIHLYRQFEKWLNYQINKNLKYKFKLEFPNITYYNRDDKAKLYRDMATYGFPKSLVACSLGLTPIDLYNLSMFENEIGLIDILQPLKSAHTQSSSSSSGAGRPTKDDGEIADKTEKGRDEDWNENRAE